MTTLDARAQQVAYAGLAGRPGAVIAMVPSTGAIRVFADSPSYDPNQVKTAAGFRALLAQTKTTPLLNRVTQAQYAPGSTFKVVTAIAAIDSGSLHPGLRAQREVPDRRLGPAAQQRQRHELWPSLRSAPL